MKILTNIKRSSTALLGILFALVVSPPLGYADSNTYISHVTHTGQFTLDATDTIDRIYVGVSETIFLTVRNSPDFTAGTLSEVEVLRNGAVITDGILIPGDGRTFRIKTVRTIDIRLKTAGAQASGEYTISPLGPSITAFQRPIPLVP